jgi:hypothetical protein
VAYEATSDATVAQTPRIDEVLVRPEPATFTSSVTFFHTEARMVQQVYYESEPYIATQTSMCGYGATLHVCSSTVTRYRQVQRTRSVMGSVEVPDAVCSSTVRFLPANDSSYLLELSYHDNNACSLACFEQVPHYKSEVENRACPAAPPPPPPRAPPATQLELH